MFAKRIKIMIFINSEKRIFDFVNEFSREVVNLKPLAYILWIVGAKLKILSAESVTR